MDETLSTKEAARRLGISPASVRTALLQERLTGKKIGRDWRVSVDRKFEHYVARRPLWERVRAMRLGESKTEEKAEA